MWTNVQTSNNPFRTALCLIMYTKANFCLHKPTYFIKNLLTNQSLLDCKSRKGDVPPYLAAVLPFFSSQIVTLVDNAK